MGTIIAQGYAGASALQLVSAVVNVPPSSTTGSITLTFNDNVNVAPAALNPAAWIITNDITNIQLGVTLVIVSNQTITLITNEQDTGFNYTLNIPQTGISAASTGYVLIAPFSVDLVGQGAGPTILYSRLVNENTIELEYSKPVVIAEAVTVSNYYISATINVAAVSQVPNSSTIFRITTAQKMVPNTVYTITVFNIQDLAGNAV